MGTEQTRRLKQNWIETVIRLACDKEREPLSKKRLLAQFVLQNHCEARVGREILAAMETTKRIRIDGDEIWSLKL